MAAGAPYPFLRELWVALVDFLSMIGGALAGLPTVLFAAVHSLTAGSVTLIVFVVYTQVERQFLYPAVMSRPGRDQSADGPRVGASRRGHRHWLGGTFGPVVAALLAIPG